MLKEIQVHKDQPVQQGQKETQAHKVHREYKVPKVVQDGVYQCKVKYLHHLTYHQVVIQMVTLI